MNHRAIAIGGFIFGIVLLVLPTKVDSQDTAVFYQAVTIGVTATALPTALTTPGGVATKSCNGKVFLAAVNFRWDPSAASVTNTTGDTLDVGDRFEITGFGNIQQFRAIRSASTDAELRVHCRR